MLSLTDINKIEDIAKYERNINDLGEVSPIGGKIFSIIESTYTVSSEYKKGCRIY